VTKPKISAAPSIRRLPSYLHVIKQLERGGGSGKPLKLDGHRPFTVDFDQVPSLLDTSVSFSTGDFGERQFMHDVLRKERVEPVVHTAGFQHIDEAVAVSLKYYSNNEQTGDIPFLCGRFCDAERTADFR
jgi:hypothetical protein